MAKPPPGVDERHLFVGLVKNLLDTYRPEGVLIWLNSQNRHLDGQSPRELIARGDYDDWKQLLDEANRLAGGHL